MGTGVFSVPVFIRTSTTELLPSTGINRHRPLFEVGVYYRIYDNQQLQSYSHMVLIMKTDDSSGICKFLQQIMECANMFNKSY